jgi:hypothetical protein
MEIVMLMPNEIPIHTNWLIAICLLLLPKLILSTSLYVYRCYKLDNRTIHILILSSINIRNKQFIDRESIGSNDEMPKIVNLAIKL